MPFGPRRGPGSGPGRGPARRRRRRRRRILVGGMVAFGAYKMSRKDAKKIQQTTGQDPEQMTDQELEQAMQQCGIERQPVTDADQDA